MSVLSIHEIFSNFQSYQTNYLCILKNPDLYYQPVQEAQIDFAFFSQEHVYLGDLLQLWLGDKWTDRQAHYLNQSFWAEQDFSTYKHLDYIFAIKNRGLFSKGFAVLWSESEQKIKEVQLEQVLPYYCHFLSLARPKREVC